MSIACFECKHIDSYRTLIYRDYGKSSAANFYVCGEHIMEWGNNLDPSSRYSVVVLQYSRDQWSDIRENREAVYPVSREYLKARLPISMAQFEAGK